MKRMILLTALLLLPTGCQQTPEQARKELADLGISFSESDFAAAVTNSDIVAVELFLNHAPVTFLATIHRRQTIKGSVRIA